MVKVSRKTFISLFLAFIIVAIGVFAAYYGIVLRGASSGSEIQAPQTTEKSTLNMYRGKFLGWADNYLRIMLEEKGIIGGFVTDENSRIVEVTAPQGGIETVRNIKDIPSDANITVYVRDSQSREDSRVIKIEYSKNSKNQ